MKLHVRITLAAILLLIAVPSSASSGNFRFGAEWGVLYNFISLEKSTFITEIFEMVWFRILYSPKTSESVS